MRSRRGRPVKRPRDREQSGTREWMIRQTWKADKTAVRSEADCRSDLARAHVRKRGVEDGHGAGDLGRGARRGPSLVTEVPEA